MSTEIKKAAKAEVSNFEADAIVAVTVETKPEVKTPEVKKVDISILLTKIPDTFTPALLDKLFNLNDGGKTVRRHLRKNFAEPVGHAHKEKWTFTKAQTDVLQYFADRYAFDLKILEPVAAAVKTA